jgi:hypothetical protein
LLQGCDGLLQGCDGLLQGCDGLLQTRGVGNAHYLLGILRPKQLCNNFDLLRRSG